MRPSPLPVFTVVLATMVATMTAPASEAESFSNVDANQNGVVERQEAQAITELAANFDAADRNQDGVLDQREFTFAMAKINAERDPRERVVERG